MYLGKTRSKLPRYRVRVIVPPSVDVDERLSICRSLAFKIILEKISQIWNELLVYVIVLEAMVSKPDTRS